MIMGMDFMTSIGITVDCRQRCIRWGGAEILLETRNTIYNDEILHMLYNAENEPDIRQEAEKTHNRILDADYRTLIIYDMKSLEMVFNHNLINWKQY
jgi:hypothetical protein